MIYGFVMRLFSLFYYIISVSYMAFHVSDVSLDAHGLILTIMLSGKARVLRKW